MTRSLEDKIAIVTGAGRGLGKAFALEVRRRGGAGCSCPTSAWSGPRRPPRRSAAQGGQAVAMETDIADESSTLAVAGQGAGALRRRGHPAQQRRPQLRRRARAPGTPGRWSSGTGSSPSTPGARGSCARPSRHSWWSGGAARSSTSLRTVPGCRRRRVLLPYACSKVAVHQITQALARALGPSGICVNSIAPGLTATEATLTPAEQRADVRRRPSPCSASSGGKSRRTWWGPPSSWPRIGRTWSPGSCSSSTGAPLSSNRGGLSMKIEYFHASKYGNGAMVAEEFRRQMAADRRRC